MQKTLMYVRKLVAVGIPREHAEAQVEIMSDFVDSNFATKQDLREGLGGVRSEMQQLSTELRGEMQQLSTELRGEMKQLGVELRADMQVMRAELSRELTFKFGGMIAVSCTIMLAAMGLLAQVVLSQR